MMRSLLSISCLLAILVIFGMTTSSVAEHHTPTDRVRSQIETQGFTITEMHRTWLGRVRITAVNSQFEREIVFRPATGEILRDHWEARDEEEEASDDD